MSARAAVVAMLAVSSRLHGPASLRRVANGRVWISIPPKTDVERVLRLPSANRSHVPKRWSLLPDEELQLRMGSLHRQAQNKRTACLVRDPTKRLLGELQHRCTREGRCDRIIEMKLINLQASVIATEPRWSERLDSEMASILPQSRYVWNLDGSVACHCVLSYDALAQAARMRVRPVVLRASPAGAPWSKELVRLYTLDAMLYRNVTAKLKNKHASACYVPGKQATALHGA